MTELSTQHCQACRAGAPHATAQQREEFMAQLPDWEIVSVAGVDRLRREFGFENFVQALAFTNKVGEIAEQEGHHPALLTQWGTVTVEWWSHKIKGLHVNDFVMAAKTDDLYR
ncbi:pterin-4-alpha-carbinolamine dehydratase [Candidatus Tenderia electrophaga]|jgi:4a-hydroxytetrahydrobiopterin dehydratase|uniref:Putative pterin-4-alpha-carbinolamine dehydratase n=1 Tax=Candidatus Tenderia electrophaga TaxID=1748243 RepID=A0A0S2TCY0_9GAMM|nr:pterin-4-alpha-carbinolamine dehydratase [Candidatus Tenderia electrophaga]